MIGLLLAVLLLALASGINTASVFFEQRSQWLSRPFGAHAWYAHMALITPGWVAFLVFETLLGNSVCLVAATGATFPTTAASQPN